MFGKCEICACNNNGSGKLSLFKFPENNDIRKIWLESCGLKSDSRKIMFLCSVHFEPSCFTDNKFKLKKNVIPTLLISNINNEFYSSNLNSYSNINKNIQNNNICFGEVSVNNKLDGIENQNGFRVVTPDLENNFESDYEFSCRFCLASAKNVNYYKKENIELVKKIEELTKQNKCNKKIIVQLKRKRN